ARAHTGTAHLVLISGTNALLRCADRLVFRGARLAQAVDLDVVGQNQVRAIAQEQTLLDVTVAAPLHLVDLTDEHRRVHHHALTEHAEGRLAQDAARQEAHHQLLGAHDQRMTGVRSTRVTDDDLGELRIDVDDLAFAFVAPLGAYNHHCRHSCFLETALLENSLGALSRAAHARPLRPPRR